MKKLFLTIMMFAVSAMANAAGTNVSSGFSHTFGLSKTVIDQHGSYRSDGNGILIAHSYNDDGSSFRLELYNKKVETDTKGEGIVLGSFQAVDYSTSAGMLSASAGSQEGTSIKFMKTEIHTDVDYTGDYIEIARLNTDGQSSYNRETGSFSSHDHTKSKTTVAMVTNYESDYASINFNY